MPDIDKINGVDASSVGSIASISGVTYANDHSIFGQTVSMLPDAHTLLSTTTISSSTANVAISSNLDATYDVYEFHFKNLHPSANGTFEFQVGSTNNTIMITTYWYQSHGSLAYSVYGDQGETSNYGGRARAYQEISPYVYPNSTDSSSTSGVLVTDRHHFMSTMTTSYYHASNPDIRTTYVAGYTSGTFTQINFKFDNGNIDSGIIQLYGVATS